MKSLLKKFGLIMSLAFLLLPVGVGAQDPRTNLGAATPNLIKQRGSLPAVIGTFIQSLLVVISILLLVYIIYGGYVWMTAQGDSVRINKAKGIIINSIIGIVIILSAYIITEYVISELTVRLTS